MSEASDQSSSSAATKRRQQTLDQFEGFPSTEFVFELAVDQEWIGKSDLPRLKRLSVERGLSPEEFLVELDIVTQEELMEALADAIGLPFVRIDPLALDADVVTSILPFRFSEKHKLVVIRRHADILTIALARPFHGAPLEDIVKMTGLRIEPVISTPSDVDRTITYFYGITRSLSRAEAELAAPTVDPGNLEQLYQLRSLAEISPDSTPLVNSVNYLLHSAFEQRASDIHFEPKRNETWVRFRIDGILHTVLRIQDGPGQSAGDNGRSTRSGKKLHSAIISRIKTMAGLDIAEKRRPQDGRIKIGHSAREVELRVSIMPVAFGEKAVLRIFDPDILLQTLDDIGFTDDELSMYKQFVSHTNGIVLVTGPTGSGKTTTLYSSLRYLATSATNITTIEDPIELLNEDFNQVAVQPKVGITFANALRTILRQDPDIIMVGEIRDLETAENAIQSALTGHLVLSTLHTNDAPSAITRLVDMGVQPFLISSTIIGVVAQRLVRLICPGCAKRYKPSGDELARLGLKLPEEQKERLRFRRGVGCPTCRNTGYVGRTGIFEIMRMTEGMRHLTRDNADAKALRDQARREGMSTLRESALRKVAKGATTVDEVRRITAEV